MATNTPNLGLRKPDQTDLVNVLTDLNDNSDKIDLLLGKTLATAKIEAAGVSAVGLHDAGPAFQVSFVMPTLTAGRWVEVLCTGYFFLFASAPGANSTLYSLLVGQDNVVHGTAYDTVDNFSVGPFPPVRTLLDNADYAAGVNVTMRLRINSASAVAISAQADAQGPTIITARVI